MRGPEEETERKNEKREAEAERLTRADARQRGEEEVRCIWPSKGLYKAKENGRRLRRLQAICVIYEALRGDRWLAGKRARENNAALYSIYRLTDTFAEGERDSPRRELSDEVVAHVQNFQFLCFTQPVWQGLHMVPTGGQGMMMMMMKKINYLQFVKRYT